MKISKNIYLNRKKHYNSLLKKQLEVIKFLSILRLIIFLAGLGFTVFFSLSKHYYLSIVTLFLSSIILIILIYNHNKLKKHKNLTSILEKINENSLNRLDGKWKSFKDTGVEFKDEDHSFSGDLDIFGDNSLFQYISTANTYLGRIKLKKLFTYFPKDMSEIYSRQEAIDELSKAINWRQRFNAEGMILPNKINDPEELFKWSTQVNALFLKPWLIIGIRLLPIITIGLSILSFVNSSISFRIPIMLLTLHLVLLLVGHKTFGSLNTAYKYKKDVSMYSKMIFLIERKKFKSKHLVNIKHSFNNNSKYSTSDQIRKLQHLFDYMSDRFNPYYFAINILLLRDYQLMISLERWKSQFGCNFKNWIETVGDFEALSSLSGIKYDNPNWVMPKFQNEPLIFNAVNMGHPLLLGSKITNDLKIQKPVNTLLITGSNMSGKSTLLRTCGINLILAYAGAPVCAETFNCSLMNIYTCMRTADNLEKNISSFYAEILRIKKLIDATKSKEPIFFLLDEIFKGTNSMDRHTGAKILIDTLTNENALGLVSTHDLELGNIDKTNFKVKNHHLKEYYIDGTIKFDYKLRDGISDTRNALYLMKMAGIDIK